MGNKILAKAVHLFFNLSTSSEVLWQITKLFLANMSIEQQSEKEVM